MAQLRCADGRLLDVVPVPVLDRTGVPYEATLRLLLDGAPFGDVGQRCAGLLAAVRAAPLPEAGELLDLRARDPDDVASAGELRVRLDPVRTWTGEGWESRTDAVVQAWGDDGTGLRAVLTTAALCDLLDGLLAACAAVGGCAGPDDRVTLGAQAEQEG